MSIKLRSSTATTASGMSWLTLSRIPPCACWVSLDYTSTRAPCTSYCTTQLTALQDVQQQFRDQLTATLCEQPSTFWGSRFSTAEADGTR